MNVDERDDNPDASQRGGDVFTKSASQPSPAETRAGGNVITKGPSQKADETAPRDENTRTAPAGESEAGTRAGGNVITKGASEKQAGNSQ